MAALIFADDRLGRAARRHHAGPGVEGEIRIAAFHQGRHVRQFGPALGRADGERAELAGPDLRHQDHRAVDGVVVAPGDEVDHRLRGALVRAHR